MVKKGPRHTMSVISEYVKPLSYRSKTERHMKTAEPYELCCPLLAIRRNDNLSLPYIIYMI